MSDAFNPLPKRKRPAYLQSQQFGGEPEQLKMFMTRGEIAKDYKPIDNPYGDEPATFWASKAREARSPAAASSLIHGAGVWDSVRETGVQSPVHLAVDGDIRGGKEIVGGHHRIISARKNDLIPVMHHNNFREAEFGRPWQRAYERGYT